MIFDAIFTMIFQTLNFLINLIPNYDPLWDLYCTDYLGRSCLYETSTDRMSWLFDQLWTLSPFIGINEVIRLLVFYLQFLVLFIAYKTTLQIIKLVRG